MWPVKSRGCCSWPFENGPGGFGGFLPLLLCFKNACEQASLTLEFLFSNLTISLPLGRHGGPDAESAEGSMSPWARGGPCCTLGSLSCPWAFLPGHKWAGGHRTSSGPAELARFTISCLPSPYQKRDGLWEELPEVFFTHRACLLMCLHLLRLLFLLWKGIWDSGH